ncbi:MAG TPA: HPF/RaiA family ribosome-associated protein [Kofleriaceae bacterium]
MDVDIVGYEFAVEPELRTWMTQRIEKIASRFGPVEHARIEIRRATAWSSVQWAVEMRVRAYATELTAEVVEMPDLELAFDDVMIDIAAQLRSRRWARDGVAERCKWCDGDEYLHVHRARQDGRPLHLSADRRTQRAVGLLEALMCRGCGHVEWFVSDPGRISPKQDHVTIVKAKPPEPDPYR